MLHKFIPDWLTSFTFLINDQYESNLFDPDSDSLDDLNFKDGDGCVIGSTISIKDKEFEVINIHFYCSVSESISSLTGKKKASMQINLIVEEKAD